MTNTKKLYNTKKAAQQAARRAGLALDSFKLRQTDDFSQWYIEPIRHEDAPGAPEVEAESGETVEAPAVAEEALASEIANAETAAPAKPKRERKAALEKEAPADEVIAEAMEIFAITKPNATHCNKVEAAHRGEMPEEPDLSAPTHAYYRRHMDRIKSAIAAGDVTALETITAAIEPKCSSRKPIRAYGLLAAIAMTNQA